VNLPIDERPLKRAGEAVAAWLNCRSS